MIEMSLEISLYILDRELNLMAADDYSVEL